MRYQPTVYITTNRYRGVPYVGVTSNLMKRIYEHRVGTVGSFTNRYNLFKLVYFEQFEVMELAIAREKQLKNWHQQWKYNLIEVQNPIWRDLAEDFGFEPIKKSN